MPLQWLPLQQRQKQIAQPRSIVSEALTPTPTRKGFAEAGGTMPNRFVEEQKAKWAEEDKLRKLERDTQTQRAQEIGMRTINQAQQQKQQQAQAPIAAPLTKENMPEAAKEMYELLKTLPDEMQNVLLQQIFTQTEPAGTITSAGKTVTMPEKYNAIADVFLSKGWATIDEAGKPVLSEPERLFEKGTFQIVEKGGKVYKFNTATNEEVELGTTDEPEKTVDAINKQANADALNQYKADPSKDFSDYKYDALIDYGVDEEVAADMAKVKEIPKDDKGKDLIKTFTDWLTGKKETSPEILGAPMKTLGAGAKPAYNEANVTSLVDVISDDVTTAERAHLKGQGATDADIDEAIKRKATK